MVLRKINIDNSVKYVPITEKKIKNKVKKFNPFQEEVNKTKIFQKIIKKILKNVAATGFGYITK